MLTPSRRRRLLVAWAALTVGLAIRALVDGPALPCGPRASALSIRLDCNRATLAELATLPGIGPGRALAIVLNRVRHGPFARREDLGRVDGIGPQTLTELLPFVVCGANELTATR